MTFWQKGETFGKCWNGMTFNVKVLEVTPEVSIWIFLWFVINYYIVLGEKVFKSCFVQLPLFSREPLPCGVWKATKLIYKRFKHEMEGTVFKEFIDTQARVSRLFDIDYWTFVIQLYFLIFAIIFLHFEYQTSKTPRSQGELHFVSCIDTNKVYYLV